MKINNMHYHNLPILSSSPKFHRSLNFLLTVHFLQSLFISIQLAAQSTQATSHQAAKLFFTGVCVCICMRVIVFWCFVFSSFRLVYFIEIKLIYNIALVSGV